MQRQLALQRMQEQEREMQMRFEQQRHLTQIRQMQNYGGYGQVRQWYNTVYCNTCILIQSFLRFLAHQNTKCSRWAIVIGLCPLSVRMSVRPYVRQQLLGKNLHWNYMAKFNETSQEASLGVPLQKYNTGSQLINNNNINNNKMADFLFCFKNISC